MALRVFFDTGRFHSELDDRCCYFTHDGALDPTHPQETQMRIGLTINSKEQYIASVPGPGRLGVHINLTARPDSGEMKRKLQIVGTDASSATDNVSLSWPEVELAVGDVVELAILEGGAGAGAPPVVRRRSSLDPSNLFSNTELATEALAIGAEFEKQLMALLRKAMAEEPEEEGNRFRLATGHLLASLGDYLYSPIWRRHPSLVPAEIHRELL
jgi:hypothetical protein